MSDSEGPDSPVGAARGGLTDPPRLVRVDRYGSVSGLVRVRKPIGVIVIVPSVYQEGPYGG